MLALTENLRLGRIFPAVTCTGPKGSQLAIAEPTAAYFSAELTCLFTGMSGKVSSDPQSKLTGGTNTEFGRGLYLSRSGYCRYSPASLRGRKSDVSAGASPDPKWREA